MSHLSACINDLAVANPHKVVMPLPNFLVENFPSEALLFFQDLPQSRCLLPACLDM